MKKNMKTPTTAQYVDLLLQVIDEKQKRFEALKQALLALKVKNG